MPCNFYELLLATAAAHSPLPTRGDGDSPFVLVIGQGDAQIGVCVMGKVRGRATNGPEDDLGFFYAGIAPAVRRGVGWGGVGPGVSSGPRVRTGRGVMSSGGNV